MTSACDLVYWYILMIRRFLVIKHLKREKALRPLDGWRCKSKWHAYDINQDAEHKPIIHFCLIWFGQFLLFLQIYKRRCAKRCVWFISRYPLIAIWTTQLCFFFFMYIFMKISEYSQYNISEIQNYRSLYDKFSKKYSAW